MVRWRTCAVGGLQVGRWLILAALVGTGGCASGSKGMAPSSAPPSAASDDSAPGPRVEPRGEPLARIPLRPPIWPEPRLTREEGPRGETVFKFVEGIIGAPRPPPQDVPGVVWQRELLFFSGSPREALAGLGARDRATTHDSLVAWTAAGRDSILRPYALRRLARLHLTLGDTAAADSAWRELAALRTPWTWEAIRARCDLALSRGDTARADGLVTAAGRGDWSESERAEWLALRVLLRLALRDTTSALDLARQAVRRYPALPPAAKALETLERTLAARGESLTVEDQRQAVEVEMLRSDRAAATRRLEDLLARPIVPERWRAELRLGEVLRQSRRFAAAHDTLRRAEILVENDGERWRCRLERARVFRDAGASDSASRCYERVATAAPDRAVRAAAWWELAAQAVDQGEWLRAQRAYQRVATEGGSRRSDAWLRAGLMALAGGREDSARIFLSRAEGEAARFWWAIVARRGLAPDAGSRVRADSVLRALAGEPGYTFYRTAARDTLGIRAWPGDCRIERAGFDAPALRLAAVLAALRLGDDAGVVLERWAAGDPRVAGADSGIGRRTDDRLLVATRIAFAAGRPRLALRLVERALATLPDSADSERWAIVPWLYPPAYDSLFATYRDSATAVAPDRSLLQAVAWKESRFDAHARSRSDAVGLLQLKRAAVTDVAGWLHEPAPSDSALLDPTLNLRYGARYLARLLERFGGNVPLALAAYNAGASTARQWTRLRAIGGDALACEEIDRPETQDYVKTILGVRQAYLELRPRDVPP
jgi:soluble lytic murein transglycosylase-like protein